MITGEPVGFVPRPPGVLKKGTAFCELQPATLAKMLMKETGLMTPTPCGQPTCSSPLPLAVAGWQVAALLVLIYAYK